MSLRFLAQSVVLTLFLAQYSYSQSRPAPSQTDTNLIHFGDLIDVDVVGSFEYDWRGTLTPEGFLDGLDKIENQVYALCRSEGEVAEAIAKEYKALRDPKVIVKILDRSNRAVAFLDGAVRFPQRFQIRRRVSLSELIILSGGITERSSGEIRIFRPRSLNCLKRTLTSAEAVDEKASQTLTIAISDLLAGSEDANPVVLSGDIVTVVEAAPVFLIGGLNVPKQISLRVETTLSRAIAMAGGIAKGGIEDRIRIFRRDGKAGKVIEANLKEILDKRAEDPILQAYDVIEVEQRGRGPRRLPPVTESVAPVVGRLSKLPLRIVD